MSIVLAIAKGLGLGLAFGVAIMAFLVMLLPLKKAWQMAFDFFNSIAAPWGFILWMGTFCSLIFGAAAAIGFSVEALVK